MDDNMGAILALFATFGLIALIIAIVMYVLYAIALSTLAKNNGQQDKAFLGWIPIANIYLMGLLSGGANLFNSYEIDGTLMGILLVVLPLITWIPFLGFLISIAFLILLVYAYYNLFRKINKENATLMTVLSFFLPFVAPIYLFIKRDAIFDNYYTDYQQM